jgi:hypothetical protein
MFDCIKRIAIGAWDPCRNGDCDRAWLGGHAAVTSLSFDPE